jgi:hypothetical protein
MPKLSETLDFSEPIPLERDVIAATILAKLGSSCGRDQTAWIEAAQIPGKSRSILVNVVDYLPELAK